MNKIFKTALLSLAAMAWLTACKKDENQVTFEGGKAPVLSSATGTSPLMLTRTNAAATALRLAWTNPEYRFTTGTSSQNVTYLLQVDTTGANFSSPVKQEISIARDLSTAFTVGELNSILTKMNLLEDMPHAMEFRVRSSLAGGTVPLFSNVIKLVVTPYLDVAVPIPTGGNLWITGNAVGSGWANPLSNPYDQSQKFTRVSSTLYELTIALPGGGNYKLLQDNGNWATQYRMIAGGTWDAGEFKKEDADPAFAGPPTAGNYKMTFNFKTGKYTVVKL